jgi:mono/diheme cytochrome c family protein
LFRSCQGCHNVANDDRANNDRKMGPSLRSLFGKVTLRNGKHADDANVREIILDGLNGMPSFRYSFRAAEIDDLMAYLHTLRGKPVESAGSTGAGYFKAYCLRCHNPDSRVSAGPDLRGRFKDEWLPLIDEGHGGSPALKEWLGEPERALLIAYLKNL